MDWLGLFSPGQAASVELTNSNNSCIAYLEGDMALTQKLRYGRGISLPPPPGAINIGDYLFTGEITQIESGYQMSAVLETTCSRQTVVSASAPFSADRQIKIDPEDWPGDPNDWLPGNPTAEQVFSGEWKPLVFIGEGLEGVAIASELVKEYFTPLLPKIRDYERRMRDTDPRYTMDMVNGGAMEMWPAKKTAQPSESVPIKFKLTDCDGAPLPNRKIVLTTPPEPWSSEPASYNGRFKSATVTTDARGRATAEFVIGNARGTATARAYFPYIKPSGCGMLEGNETLIQIRTARQYKGNLHYRAASPGLSASLSGDVTWIEGAPESDSFLASGTIQMSVSMECTRIDNNGREHIDKASYDGPVRFDGEMNFNVPADEKYSFAFGTNHDDSQLICNGVGVPYGVLFVSPMCDEYKIGDGKVLKDSSVCSGDGSELEWRFELLE